MSRITLIFLSLVLQLNLLGQQYNQVITKFSEDSKYFVKAWGNVMSISNLEKPESGVRVFGAKSKINDVKIDTKNSRIYTCNKDGLINSWTFDGVIDQTFGKTVFSINCIEIVEENNFLIAGDGAGFIYIWDIQSGELLTDIRAHQKGISDLIWKNGIIYSTSFEGSIAKTSYDDTYQELNSNLLFSNFEIEIYDLASLSNDRVLFSFLNPQKDYHELCLGVVSLTTGKLLDEHHTNSKTWKSTSHLNLTSLGLMEYGVSSDQFTLYNINPTYVVNEKGKITSEVLQNPDTTGNWLEDVFNSVYDYSFEEPLSITISPQKDYIYFNEWGQDVILKLNSEYVVSSKHLSGRAYNLIESPYNDTFKICYPNSLTKDLSSFTSQIQEESNEVIPIVQSRFLFYHDRIYNPDSTLIATSNESNYIKIFDVNNMKLLANIVSDEMVLRIVRHPFLPMFASLHIDGKINLWSFEDFHLIKSLELLDEQKARKILKKSGDPNRPLLITHRYYGGEQDENPLFFRFSPLGDEIWAFMPNSIYDQTDAINFNVYDLMTAEQIIRPLIPYYDYDNNSLLPIETKNDFNNLNFPDFDLSEPIYSRIKLSEIQSSEIDSVLGFATKDMETIVPKMFQVNFGQNLVLDYGDYITTINLNDFSTKTIELMKLPHKYQEYTSRIIFEKRDLLASDSTEWVIFKFRRYIDTAYVYNYQGKLISSIDTHGEELPELYSDYYDGTSAYFLIDYYLLNTNTKTVEQINQMIYDSTSSARSFYVEERMCNWDEIGTGHGSYIYGGEMTQIEAEQISRYNENIRGLGNSWDGKVTLDCKLYSWMMDPRTYALLDESNELISLIGPQSTAVVDQEFLINSNYYLTNNLNGEIIFWDTDPNQSSQPIVKLIGNGNELFAVSPDNYYMALTPGAKGMLFRKGGVMFEFEQFDLKYNRPDIILERLGFADPALVTAYYAAYQKRLKKMGFTEDMLKDDFHLPVIEIENFEEMPTLHDQGSINLKLNLKDSKYKLDRINVWVNDVAIYGTNGISLRDKNVQEYTTEIEAFLAKGKNKVQVSVLNQAGAESYKETFAVNCTAGKDQPDLYLITIGASEFQQSDFNLTYASKDAKDLANLMTTSNAYANVFSKTLINEHVTKENVLVLSSFLEKADINDHVILFLAGHGVLSADLDYYLATYDMDFGQPEKRGLAYEDLEGLLDGIKPLTKTLIIDACHSGEIDKEDFELANNENTVFGDIQFRTVGANVQSKLGTKNTLELTKSLFTDLRKGTGATVISSAGGMEFAMESDEWNNGLFTYTLLNGLKSGKADLNNDGEIWLSELQKYVSNEVTEMSNGLQQPTSRIENQTVDFRIW